MALSYRVSVDTIISQGIWVNLCELKGMNPYAVSEGLIDKEKVLILTQEEAEKIGLTINV